MTMSFREARQISWWKARSALLTPAQSPRRAASSMRSSAASRRRKRSGSARYVATAALAGAEDPGADALDDRIGDLLGQAARFDELQSRRRDRLRTGQRSLHQALRRISIQFRGVC